MGTMQGLLIHNHNDLLKMSWCGLLELRTIFLYQLYVHACGKNFKCKQAHVEQNPKKQPNKNGMTPYNHFTFCTILYHFTGMPRGACQVCTQNFCNCDVYILCFKVFLGVTYTYMGYTIASCAAYIQINVIVYGAECFSPWTFDS